MPFLDAQHLFFQYHDNNDWLIKELDLAAEKDEVIVIHGANGCGKTTLLSLLCGIIPKAIKGNMRGHININGMDTRDLLLPELSPLISMVFQDPDLQLSFPIVEQELAFGPENLQVETHDIHKRIQHISEMLGIAHLLKSDISTLSYGQRKLVAIASLFTLSPDIFLLDEPEDGLSMDSIRNIQNCIRLHKPEKLTIIASTTQVFNEIADRIIPLS